MRVMKNLLNELIENRKDMSADASAVQITMTNGCVMAGALRHSSYPDVYQLRTVMQKQGTRQLEGMDCYFPADAVSMVVVPIEASAIAQVESSLIVPGVNSSH